MVLGWERPGRVGHRRGALRFKTLNAATILGLTCGAVLGAVMNIGLVGTSSYVSTLFEGRSNTLWWINALYNLVVFAVWA